MRGQTIVSSCPESVSHLSFWRAEQTASRLWLDHFDGAVQPIAAINLWKPIGSWGNGLTNFYVFVSDTPFLSTEVGATRQQAGVTNFHFAASAATVTSLSVGRTARYVRVQLNGQNYLSLAEVQVFTGEAPTFAPGVLPDVQTLAAIGYPTGSQARYNNAIDTLRDWIPRENVKAVLCVGDLVHLVRSDGHQDVYDEDHDQDEWTIAANAWSRLQGQCLVAIAPGNHDWYSLAPPGPSVDYSEFRTRFDWIEPATGQGGCYSPDPEPRQGHYGGIQNAYWRKTIGGLPFFFLTLEYNTTITPVTCTDWSTESDLIGWAKGVIASHSNDLVVLVTHDYLWGLHRDYLWSKLINGSPNVVVVLCGHAWPSTRNQRPNQADRTVNEIRFDYQDWDGWPYTDPIDPDYISDLKTSAIARLMTVDPLSNRVRVKQWGCEMGGWLGLPAGNFEFILPVDPRP